MYDRVENGLLWIVILPWVAFFPLKLAIPTEERRQGEEEGKEEQARPKDLNPFMGL